MRPNERFAWAMYGLQGSRYIGILRIINVLVALKKGSGACRVV